MLVLAVLAGVLGHAALAAAQSMAGPADTVLVHGRVLAGDSADAPARGARITLITGGGSASPLPTAGTTPASVSRDGGSLDFFSSQGTLVPGLDATTLVTTDAEGRFAIGVPRTGSWSLRITKAGFAPVEFPSTDWTGDSLSLRMPRGAAVGGRVTDRQGDPLPGLVVQVTPVCAPPCEADTGPANARSTETDDLGEYRVGSLPAGTWEVRVAASGAYMISTISGGDGLNVVFRAGPAVASGAHETEQVAPPPTTVRLRAGDDVSLHLIHDDDGQRLRNEQAYAQGFNSGAQSALASRGLDTSDRATGIVRGRVTGPTGRPAAGARVQFVPTDGVGPRVVSTGADGRYEAAALPPGSYRINVTQAGRPPVQFGQRRAQEAGTPLSVRAGATIEDIDIRLPSSGVVSGRVVDGFGEPVEGVAVHVLERRFTGGRTALVPVSGAPTRTTDDRGHYRIGGLLPGTYYVAAFAAVFDTLSVPSGLMAQGLFGMPPAAPAAPGGSGSLQTTRVVMAQPGAIPRSAAGGDARIYHPGSTSVAGASPVRIDTGLDAYGTDITLVPLPQASVQGLVLDSTGAPVRGSATLLAGGRPAFPAPPPRAAVIQPDGRFTFPHVPPGDYLVLVASRQVTVRGTTAQATAHPQALATLTATTVSSEFALHPVFVDDTTVEIAMHTSPPARARGRLVIDGDATLQPGAFVVAAAPAEADRPATASATVRPDGTFDLDGLLGPVRLRLAQAPAGWYLRSVVVNGVDMVDTPVTFEAVSGSVAVLVAPGAEIAGRGLDARREPHRDYSVVAFPTDPNGWYDQSRFLKLARSAPDGSFRIQGLPPGEYWVAAVDGLPGGADWGTWQDPDVLNSLIAAAQRVVVRGTERVTTDLRVVRMGP
jgi:hypothetical protein